MTNQPPRKMDNHAHDSLVRSEVSKRGMTPDYAGYILKQASLFTSESTPVNVIEQWLERRGMPYLNARAGTLNKPLLEAWDDPTVRRGLTKLWIRHHCESHTGARARALKRLGERHGGEAGSRESMDESQGGTIRKKQLPPRSSWAARARIFAPKLPVLQSLREYDWRADLRADLVAGLSTGVNMVPKGLAFAFLANLPPAAGLYSACFPALVYFLLGTSKHLGVAPSPLVALLAGAGISTWCSDERLVPSPIDTGEDLWVGNCTVDQYSALFFKMTCTQGIVLTLMGLCKAGWVLRFFSRPVLSGFLSAAAVIIALSQIHHLIFDHRVDIPNSVPVLNTLVSIFTNLEHIHVPTLLFSLGCFVVLLVFKTVKATHHLYSILLVVISIGVTYVLVHTSENFSIDITGRITVHLPKVDLTPFKFVEPENLFQWFLQAIMLAVVGFVESSSAAQMCAFKYDYKVDVSQEMVAVGVGNLLGGTLGCMPTMGAVGTTRLLETLGGRSRIASLMSALVVLLAICVTVPTDLLYYLPKPALALIIMSAVMGLIDLQEIRFLRKGHMRDFVTVMVLFVLTLVTGIDQGLIWAIVFCVGAHVYRSGNTEVYEVGRVPGTDIWTTDRDDYPILTYDDFVVVGFNGPLFFGNDNRFKEFLCSYLHPPKVERIGVALVLDASRIAFVDASGVHALEQVVNLFGEANKNLFFAALNGKVRQKMAGSDILSFIGKDHFFDSVAECVRVLRHKRPAVRGHDFRTRSSLEGETECLVADSPRDYLQLSDESETRRSQRDNYGSIDCLNDDLQQPADNSDEGCWSAGSLCLSRCLRSCSFSSSPFSQLPSAVLRQAHHGNPLVDVVDNDMDVDGSADSFEHDIEGQEIGPPQPLVASTLTTQSV